MSYFVYLLGSHKNSLFKTYVGYTNNLNKRLHEHNKGKGAKSTRGRIWKIIYSEKCSTRGEAMSREYYLKKNKKLRDKIKKNYKCIKK